MQKAVQLLSAAQARTFNTDLHKRMRVVFQMADRTTKPISRRSRRTASWPPCKTI